METVRVLCAWTLLLIGLSPELQAADLHVAVIDANDTPVAGVAVVVNLNDPDKQPTPRIAVMDQIQEQFVPNLLVVEVGSQVDFPNSDAVLHHVYSFSETKRFELPLFHGRVHPPVIFDAPGLVIVGCNIHDHMVGHILVVETPWHGITDAQGTVTFEGVPEADYRVELFHPDLEEYGAFVAFGSTRVPAQRRLSMQVPGRRDPGANEALAWEDY